MLSDAYCKPAKIRHHKTKSYYKHKYMRPFSSVTSVKSYGRVSGLTFKCNYDRSVDTSKATHAV